MAKKRSKKPTAEKTESKKKTQKESAEKKRDKFARKDEDIERLLKEQPVKKKKKQKGEKKGIKEIWQDLKRKREERDKNRVKPHKSFKRSYREDYRRELNIPGIMYHIFATFKILFKNWKLFLPFLIIVIVLNAVLVGIMDEGNYTQYREILDDTSMQVAGGDIGDVAKAGLLLVATVSTGGLSGESSEAATVFEVLIFLLIWLTTIFLIRHRLAGNKVKLREGLYNAMTPLISTLMVFVVAVIQCIPIFLLIIVYSAAVQTDFLATPFYALLFFIFAALMILLSGYLLSSSLIALVAVSAPGLYPMKALNAASDLMMGRRINFILRLVALILMMAILWVVILWPLVFLDIVLKNFAWAEGIPFVPICLTTMTCFSLIYATAYLYLYYRWMLET